MRLITLVNTSELFRTSATGVTGLIIVSILDKPVLSDDDIKQLESFPMIPTGASKANRSLNKYLLDEGLIESDQSKVDAKKLNVKHYEDKKSLTHLLAPHIAYQEIQFVITWIKEWLDSDKATLERISLLRGQKTKQAAELEKLVEAKAKQHAARFKVTFTSKK